MLHHDVAALIVLLPERKLLPISYTKQGQETPISIIRKLIAYWIRILV